MMSCYEVNTKRAEDGAMTRDVWKGVYVMEARQE